MIRKASPETLLVMILDTILNYLILGFIYYTSFFVCLCIYASRYVDEYT